MPGNFRKPNLALFQPDIPEVCFANVTVAVKAKLKLDELDKPAYVVVAATSQESLMIFHDKKLYKLCAIPFKDCFKILAYHGFKPGATKEFIVVLSKRDGVAVVDIQTALVVQTWNSASDVKIQDKLLLGFPQVVLHFNNQETVAVSYESNWEKIDSDTPETEVDGSALNKVVQALDNQVKNVKESLYLVDNQISLRQSVLVRSITVLSDTSMCKSNRIQAPSYTIKLNMGNPVKSGTTEQLVLDDPVITNKVELCGIWQFIDYISNTLVVGVAFTNISDSTLIDVDCFFISSYEEINYQLHYYHMDPQLLTNVSQDWNGFYKLLKSASTSGGNLKPHTSIVVIVTAPIPEFSKHITEICSVFLTCKVSEDCPKRLQLNLGNCCLNFNDILKREMNFNPSSYDLTLLRRNVLGLATLLKTQGSAIFSTKFTSAFSSFKNLCTSLGMQYLSPVLCFYAEGVYGHVCVLVEKNTTHELHIKIRAHTQQKLRWFIRHIKSNTGDDCIIVENNNNENTVKCAQPLERLDSVIDLLTSAEIVDDEPILVEDSVPLADPNLDKIRTHFLKTQGSFFKIPKGRNGVYKVPLKQYRIWQDKWFDK